RATPPSGPGAGSARSSAAGPGPGRHAAATPRRPRPGSPPRRVAARRSPLFFGDVLEHPLVQEEFGDEQLEALDLGLELADAAAVVNLGGVVLLPPAVVRGLGDAELAADVSHRQPLGQVALGLPKQPPDLLCAPSLAHESLLDLSYP